MTCPGGYQEGVGTTCVIMCPPDFKYIQEGGTQKCVYITDNTKSVMINALPKPPNPNTPTDAYTRETARVSLELLNIRNKLTLENDTRTFLKSAKAQGDAWNSYYGAIQSDYALYDANLNTLRNVTNSLRTFRPPTAPSDDVEKERRAISATLQTNYLFLQISLFLVLLVLVVYVILPSQYAHFVAFLILISGIMIGIFLRK